MYSRSIGGGLWNGGKLLCCLGALLLLLSACSRQEPESFAENDAARQDAGAASEESPHKSLRWMGHWKGEGRREQLVREVLEEFAFTHPQVDVELEFAADILPENSQRAAGIYIAEMIRSGNLEWDVIWLDPLIYYYVSQELDDWNWGSKYLVDFSEIDGFRECHKPSLVEGPDAHKHTGGVFTGAYIEGFYYALWYNKDLADRLGISIREDGMTAEDLLGYMKQLHTYNQQTSEPVSAFVDFKGTGSLFRLFYSLLLSAWHDGVSRPDGDALESAAARSIAFLQEMGNVRPPAPMLTADSWNDAAHALMDGKVLFFSDATWRYCAFEKIDPEGLKKLRLAHMPEFADGGRHVIGGYMPTWAVLKNAPGRDEGIELMKYWIRPSIAERWVRYTKCPTGLKGNLYDPRFGRDVYADYQQRLTSEGRVPQLDPRMFYDDPQAGQLIVDQDLLFDTLARLYDGPSPAEERQ